MDLGFLRKVRESSLPGAVLGGKLSDSRYHLTRGEFGANLPEARLQYLTGGAVCEFEKFVLSRKLLARK